MQRRLQGMRGRCTQALVSGAHLTLSTESSEWVRAPGAGQRGWEAPFRVDAEAARGYITCRIDRLIRGWRSGTPLSPLFGVPFCGSSSTDRSCCHGAPGSPNREQRGSSITTIARGSRNGTAMAAASTSDANRLRRTTWPAASRTETTGAVRVAAASTGELLAQRLLEMVLDPSFPHGGRS